MKTKFIVILVAVALGFLVLSFSVIGLVGERGSLTRSEFMDTELFKIRILDWINQERAKNGLSALNLDEQLSDIAYSEAVKIANSDSDEYEKIINQNETAVVESYGHSCVSEDGNDSAVTGIMFSSDHTRFRQVEPVVNWYLSQTVQDKPVYEKLFDPEFETIGIGISMSTEKFYVLQYLC